MWVWYGSIILINLGVSYFVEGEGFNWWYFVIVCPIMLVGLSFFVTRVNLTDEGICITQARGQTMIKWDKVDYAETVWKGKGHDVAIVLKNGSFIEFSPFGVSIDIVGAINEQVQRRIENP